MQYARIRVYAEVGQVMEVSFDWLEYGEKTHPACLVCFDDAYAGVGTYALPVMSSRNQRGSVYVITDLVGGALYMDAAKLGELAAAGWTVGNHTTDHTRLSTLDLATATAKIADASSWLAAECAGLGRQALCVSIQ